MTPQDRALICYDDSGVAGNRDYQLASQLAHNLQRRNVGTQMSSYTHTPLLDDTYQWLIVIYSPHGVQQRHIAQAIDTAMERSVERKMRGVFLLTTSNPSTIPAQWASIRSYGASSTAEEGKAIDGLLQAMNRVKVPYDGQVRDRQAKQMGGLLQAVNPVKVSHNETETPVLQPSKPIVVPTPLGKTLSLRILVPVVVVVLVVVGAVLWPKPDTQTNSHATHNESSPVPPPISFPVPESNDPQQWYQTIIEHTTPTIVEFGQNELQWEQTHSQAGAPFDCELKLDHTYHATIAQNGLYRLCMAKASKYQDFAYQVRLTVNNGNIGGVIFRSDEALTNYYRFWVTDTTDAKQPNFFVSSCNQANKCDQFMVNQGQKLLEGRRAPVELTKSVTLTVIAHESWINLYVNETHIGKKLQVDGQGKNPNIPPIAGQIGFYAASVNKDKPNTDVTFSDLKIWWFDK